jgi:uncharacterized protein (TIGR02996 family)
MSGEEGAFLRAIFKDPDDDGLRLIYADWLEEQGDPRGELVRLQCLLLNLGLTDPRRPELEERARLLAAEHGNPLIRLPQRSRLLEKGRKRRVIRLSGPVQGTIEYSRRRGRDVIRVNGEVVCDQFHKAPGWIEWVPVPGPLGLVRAGVTVFCGIIRLQYFLISLDSGIAYEEK